MSLQLYEIQPAEDAICKETVEFFLDNPDQLFKKRPSIRIFKCAGQPFNYYAIDGNSRLYVCHKLGIIEIPKRPIVPDKEYLFLPSALGVYEQRIRTWSDLEGRILTRDEINASE